MKYFNTDLYQNKRSVINYCKNLTCDSGRVEQKFVSDMTYGMLASGDTKLSAISMHLNEDAKRINTVDRLSKNLQKPLSPDLNDRYQEQVLPLLGDRPIILVDDTDINKKYGKEFEYLDRVLDGSNKAEKKLVNGYICTECVGITARSRQPISLFSEISSTLHPEHTSVNTITDKAVIQIATILGRAGTFTFDRGYDCNRLINLFHNLPAASNGRHHFITRMMKNRKYKIKGKSYSTEELAACYKGRYRLDLQIWNKDKSKLEVNQVAVSPVRVITSAHEDELTLIIVYRDDKDPMYLLTNNPDMSKQAVCGAVKTYISRWRVEEYFRHKKQSFHFEDYRVRSFTAMQQLNQLLTYALGWLAAMAEQTWQPTHYAARAILYAKPIRTEVCFILYRLSLGVRMLFMRSRTSLKGWFKPRGQPDRQLTFAMLGFS